MHLHTQNLPWDPRLQKMTIPGGWKRGKESCLETWRFWHISVQKRPLAAYRKADFWRCPCKFSALPLEKLWERSSQEVCWKNLGGAHGAKEHEGAGKVAEQWHCWEFFRVQSLLSPSATCQNEFPKTEIWSWKPVCSRACWVLCGSFPSTLSSPIKPPKVPWRPPLMPLHSPSSFCNVPPLHLSVN